MKQTLNPKYITLILFVLMAAVFRIIATYSESIWANYSTIGAMALFGGAYFKENSKSLLFPLLTLLISDIVINKIVYAGKYGFFYERWYITYIIFAMIVWFGHVYLNKINVLKIASSAILASVGHWLLSDFFYWVFGGTNIVTKQPLSRDLAGLLQAFAQGFPFMQNFMIGTCFFSLVMFGAYELLKRNNPKLVLN